MRYIGVRFCALVNGALLACVFGLVCSAATHAAEPTIRFKDITEQAGLIAPLAGLMGHGGAVGDIDGDGLLDVYLGGFCDRPNSEYAPATGPVANVLLRNSGNKSFSVVDQPVVQMFGRTSGAVFADLDNNGTLELYSANNAKSKSSKTQQPQQSASTLPSKLFRNDGGEFVEISESSGACPPSLHTARNVGVFDYNADGLLDLFVVEDRFTPKPRSVLFKNLGGLKFDDANEAAGLPNDIFGLGLAVADINEDRVPDFFVPHSNRMFLSQGGGKYREATELRETFAWKPLDGEDWPCGAAFGDLNNDGRLDLVLSIHSVKARNRVFLNEALKDGIPRFRDVTTESGLDAIVPARCPHVEVQDFDNDGRLDIYFSAGWLADNGSFTPLIYRNTGTKNGVPQFVAPREVKAPMVYYPAGPSGDFNRDGKLDLLLVNWFAGNHSRLLINESGERDLSAKANTKSGHWLDVLVVGKSINRMGIGSRVRVYEAGKLGEASSLLGLQEITTGYGYASGQEAACHFGLAGHATVDVEILLPNAKRLTRLKVAADQRLVINEE